MSTPTTTSSSRRKHGRTKSGIPDEPVILQGWVARESNVVDKLLNRRYAALYPHAFVTYRRDTDDAPSKVWPISAGTSVSKVQAQQYNLRHKHTSTLMAVARGRYDQVEMWGFTVTWQSYQPGGDTLKLAFDTQQQAGEWHAAFQEAIGKQAMRTVARTDSDRSVGSSFRDEAPSPQSIEPRRAAFEAPQGGEPQEEAAAPRRAAAPTDGGARAAPGGAAGGGGASARRSRAWASVLHVNGVAVYVEEQDADGEGGAIMVSAIVRAPPTDVFKNLVQLRKSEGLGVLMGARVLEKIDANTQIITQQWKPVGAIGGLCAPREVVLLRTWRQDSDDGTFIVLYQSVEHRAVPRSRGRGWYAPVRVEVQAAGFTVSPLMSKYVKLAGGEESHESLVTLVLKADMGGLLSEQSAFGKAAGPLGSAAMRAVLEPVVTSVVLLRDKVEQDRFVVRPLSMSAGEEAAEEPTERVARPRLQRTTTMLAYRKEPLLAAQKHAAEAAVAAATPRPSIPHAAPGLPAAAEALAEPAAAASAEEALDTAAANAWAVGGTCDPKYWECPGDAGFKLRGASYLTDKKKSPAGPPMFELVAVDLLQLEDHMFNVCRYLPSVRQSPAPFLFCVQLMVPCVPPISLVATWAAPTPVAGKTPEELVAEYEQKTKGPAPDSVRAFFMGLTEFLEGDGKEADARRNKKFKLIPNIPKGSWIIRQSVGTTPVILGQKLTTKYARGPNYFEVDVDISSSSVAASVTNLVAGATKSLTVDLGVLLEGQTPQTLPEQLLGTIRLNAIDLKSAAYLDEATGRVFKAGTM
ncbi:hypothetical protein ABPG75_000174 [Micractinium tetrahymenae]